ncbi:MAG: glycosyltransferase family 2 protein [Clostridia bacterium]|nr:glycosyltransferase family 2 protein [Clostridia bacterium]
MISVAMCTYNGEKFVAEQLESIINQSHKVDEIIICDDCSNDDTVNICKDILQKWHGNWKIVINEKKLNVTKNFEKCYSLCSGDYIFSSDQDDIWNKNKVETVMRAFDDKTVLVFSDAVMVDTDRNVLCDSMWQSIAIKPYMLESTSAYSKYILKRFLVCGATMAFKKTILDYSPIITEPCLHDMWIGWLAPCFGEIKAIPDKLIEYRRHSSTVTDVGKLQISKSNQVDRFCDLKFLRERMIVFQQKSPQSNNFKYTNEYKKAVDFYGIFCIHNKIKKIYLLLISFVNGNYKKFRGCWKLLLLDIFYILFEKSKN